MGWSSNITTQDFPTPDSEEFVIMIYQTRGESPLGAMPSTMQTSAKMYGVSGMPALYPDASDVKFAF